MCAAWNTSRPGPAFLSKDAVDSQAPVRPNLDPQQPRWAGVGLARVELVLLTRAGWRRDRRTCFHRIALRRSTRGIARPSENPLDRRSSTLVRRWSGFITFLPWPELKRRSSSEIEPVLLGGEMVSTGLDPLQAKKVR